MRYILIILFILTALVSNAQLPVQTIPNQYSTGYFRWGWPRADSGIINSVRDTFYARYNGTQLIRVQGGDTALWFNVGRNWFRPLLNRDTISLSNRINLKLSISDTTNMLLPYLRKVDTTAKWVTKVYRKSGSDSVFYVIGGVPIFGFKDTLGTGGGGSVTSVGLSMPSAFTVTGSPITTSGAFNVSGAGTTLQYIRGNGTLATFDTTAIPDFYLKIRGLLSGTSPITYNTTTGAIGINNASTSGAKGAATFTSAFSDNGLGTIDLANVTSAGTCINCDITFDAKGRATSYASGTPPQFVNAPGAGDTLSISDTLKRLNNGYGILHAVTANNITHSVDTSSANSLVTQYDLSLKLNNTNIGTGFPWLNETTQQIKKVANSPTITWDSISTSNTLTAKVDTSLIATQYDISLKLNSTDTTNKWINNIRRRAGTDTVEYFKNGSWQFAFRDSTESPQWYVDGTAGNDNNDGRSAERAVKTITKLLTLPISKYNTINVARGSYFREFLNKESQDSIIIIDYGLGTKPVFDAADSAYNYLFAAAPGTTNLYGISWANQFRDNTDVSQISVWENGKRLIRAVSKAQADTIKGSYWPKSVTQPAGTDSIFVHSSNSSSIVNNGYLYEITRRPAGINVRDGCKVYNMHTKRNGSNDGSFESRHNSYIQGVIAEDGVKHNFFMSSGTAENCVAWKCDSAFVGGTTMFVSFTTSTGSDTMDCVYRNCIAVAGKNNDPYQSTTITGLYAHVGAPAPGYRTVIVDGGHYINCASGIDGEPATLTIKNANFYNCAVAISKNAIGTLNVSNSTFTRCADAINSNVPNINVHHNKIHLFSNSQNVVEGSFVNINATWNTLYADDIVNPVFIFNKLAAATPNSLTLKHNVFVVNGANITIPIQYNNYATTDIGGNLTINADSNYYTLCVWVFTNGSQSLATMQGTYNKELKSSNGILPNRFYGNTYTQDYFLPATDTLFGKGGSETTYDSIFRFAYNVYDITQDSLFKIPSQTRIKSDLNKDNNINPVHALNTQNLYVYKSTQLYDGGKTWNRIYHSARTIYYQTGDSLALATKWYVDSLKSTIGNTLYTGDGTIAGNRNVNANNLNLTFSDVNTFRINHDIFAQARADGTFPFSNVIIAPSQQLWMAYTPVPGVYSKGAAIIIDTNNNVSIGSGIMPTTAPLYTSGSAFIQGLQSSNGNFYRVTDITANQTLNLTHYWINADATSGNITITLPAASTAFGSTMGIQYVIRRVDASANTITISRAGSDLINGATTTTLTTQYEVKEIQAVSASAWGLK